MSQWLVRLLKKTSPETRLFWAARLFLFSLIGAVISAPIAYSAQGWFGVILMTISWLAVTFTAWDIIQTADVRNEQD